MQLNANSKQYARACAKKPIAWRTFKTTHKLLALALLQKFQSLLPLAFAADKLHDLIGRPKRHDLGYRVKTTDARTINRMKGYAGIGRSTEEETDLLLASVVLFAVPHEARCKVVQHLGRRLLARFLAVLSSENWRGELRFLVTQSFVQTIDLLNLRFKSGRLEASDVGSA
eukprot:3281397-Pleurochrysis_carterae.AAC.1